MRMGLAAARGLAFALDLPVAGVSTLDALAAGAPGALPVVDAGRREVFTRVTVRRSPRRPRSSSSRSARSASATAPSAIARSSRSAAPRSRPTTTSGTGRARGFHAELATRVRLGRGDRAALPAHPRRRAEGMTNVVELRRLELRDLNEIEEIERGSYPTPWSRSMFASELAKPSSLCLGAFDPRPAARWLPRDLALRRRLARDERRGGAVTPPAGNRLDAAPAPVRAHLRRAAAAATRSRCASPTPVRSSSTSGSASARAACGAATTRTIARTR